MGRSNSLSETPSLLSSVAVAGNIESRGGSYSFNLGPRPGQHLQSVRDGRRPWLSQATLLWGLFLTKTCSIQDLRRAKHHVFLGSFWKVDGGVATSWGNPGKGDIPWWILRLWTGCGAEQQRAPEAHRLCVPHLSSTGWGWGWVVPVLQEGGPRPSRERAQDLIS